MGHSTGTLSPTPQHSLLQPVIWTLLCVEAFRKQLPLLLAHERLTLESTQPGLPHSSNLPMKTNRFMSMVLSPHLRSNSTNLTSASATMVMLQTLVLH